MSLSCLQGNPRAQHGARSFPRGATGEHTLKFLPCSKRLSKRLLGSLLQVQGYVVGLTSVCVEVAFPSARHLGPMPTCSMHAGRFSRFDVACIRPRARPIPACRVVSLGSLPHPAQKRRGTSSLVHAAATFSLDEEMLARERPPARPSPPELPEVGVRRQRRGKTRLHVPDPNKQQYAERVAPCRFQSPPASRM